MKDLSNKNKMSQYPQKLPHAKRQVLKELGMKYLQEADSEDFRLFLLHRLT
jgi:hypothetical protein